MLVANESKKKTSTPLKAGTTIARCVQIIDLGDQYNDLSQKYARKVMLTFELPKQRIDVNGESKPRLISKTYTLSLNEKATLRKDLESWLGKKLSGDDFPFDIRSMLSKPCLLTVVNDTSKNGKEYSKVGSVTPPLEDMNIPDQETESLVFDIDGEEALDKIELLPEWIQKTIKDSPSFKELEEKWKDIKKDDLPF